MSRVESGRGQASVFRKSHAGWGPHPEGADNTESQTQTFKEGYSSRVRKTLGEWSDDLCVIVLYPDPRAERLQRRLEQLQRIDDWLQRLGPWEQRLLPAPFALFMGGLVAWLNLLLPAIDPNQLPPGFWLGP